MTWLRFFVRCKALEVSEHVRMHHPDIPTDTRAVQLKPAEVHKISITARREQIALVAQIQASGLRINGLFATDGGKSGNHVTWGLTACPRPSLHSLTTSTYNLGGRLAPMCSVPSAELVALVYFHMEILLLQAKHAAPSPSPLEISASSPPVCGVTSPLCRRVRL